MASIFAVYENEVFKPLEKVNFKEHAIVEVTPKASVVDEVAGTWNIENTEEFIDKIKSGWKGWKS
ncbi:MAG: antitoxin family protein [Candidatus Altarchaeum sp.]|nr:antitoxin family protein [Candidatus Altarchaeum sp.]